MREQCWLRICDGSNLISTILFCCAWSGAEAFVAQEDLFRKFGNIRTIHMKVGFAFVEFEDPRDAEDAVRE